MLDLSVRKVFDWLTPFVPGLRLRLLLLVLLACTPLAGLILHTASDDRRRDRDSWEQRAQKITQLATREEERVVGQTRQLLLAVSESSAVRSGNWRTSQRLLSELFSSYPGYANFGVIHTNGEVVASAVPLDDGTNQSDRRFFRRAMDWRAFAIGDYPVHPVDGNPHIAFGCPVIDRHGQVQAVVFAVLDMDWSNIRGSEVAAQLPKAATWTEVDHNGTVLVRYPEPNESRSGQPRLDEASVKDLFEQGSGLIEAQDSKGVRRLYGYSTRHSQLAASSVITLLWIPEQVLFASADQMLERNLLWLGVAAGLALLIGWVGSHFFVVRPVRALVRFSQRVAQGDLAARIGLPHGRDEFGQLTRAFDQMAYSLEQREMQRQLAEETLETRDKMIRELPVLPAAVYVCDPLGAIELYNRTAVDLWGYEPQDHFASKRFCGSFKTFHPDGSFMSPGESPMAEVLRSGSPVRNREFMIGRPDGTEVSVLANVVPLRNPDGVLIGAVSCLQDISDRKASEQRLKEYSDRLQLLSRKLVESQETERRHIARELHDEVGQSLTVAEMNLQTVLRSPRAASLALPLRESINAVERVLEQIHDLSLNLRPAMLDDLGLEPALRWHTKRQAALAGLKAEFHADPLEQRLDPMIEAACFRVAQEALTNVVRHAHAKEVSVDLRSRDGQLHLTVTDDGVGFDVAKSRDRAAHGASLGLLSMEERAILADGGLECISAPGQGAEIHAWFPFKWRAIESES
jgi:PAS domain S-box-containing protein